MTSSQIQKLCQKWQKRLRLQDWSVKVVFVKNADIDGAFARTRKSDNYKDALVQISEPDQLNKEWLGSHDLEVTLVHELLHLHASGFDHLIKRETAEDGRLETAMEHIALALVGLDRHEI